MDWASSTDWGVVLATLAGPVLAVVVTRWNDKRAHTRQQRVHVFRTLMATRRQTINVDHVSALNLIEIEFYDHDAIQEAWREYLAHLSGPFPENPTQAERLARENTRLDLLTRLLFEMAKELDYKNLQQIDIRNGGYAPDGWRFRDERTGRAQDFLVAMSEGRAVLPVRIDNIPPNPEPPRPGA